MRIRAVRSRIVELPLARPIVLGRMRYDTRDYVLVEVEADDGVIGIGFGMARQAPVETIVERMIGPLLVGEDADRIAYLWDRVHDRHMLVADGSAFMRALSVVDIALWDLRGKHLGLPLWRLWGEYRERIPVQVAGGYPVGGDGTDDLAAEVAGYADRGYPLIKIAGGSLADATRRIEIARRAAPTVTLTYDAHWAWRDVPSAVPHVRRWGDLGLDLLEDPFPSFAHGRLAELKARTGIALALGEDLSGRWAFRDLLRREVADVIRIDATVMGGLTEAARVVALADAEGLPVSPHVFPEVHQHLAAAYGNVTHVEMTEPDRGLEGLFRLFSVWIEVRDGELTPSDAPGLGLVLDPAAVERFAVR